MEGRQRGVRKDDVQAAAAAAAVAAASEHHTTAHIQAAPDRSAYLCRHLQHARLRRRQPLPLAIFSRSAVAGVSAKLGWQQVVGEQQALLLRLQLLLLQQLLPPLLLRILLGLLGAGGARPNRRQQQQQCSQRQQRPRPAVAPHRRACATDQAACRAAARCCQGECIAADQAVTMSGWPLANCRGRRRRPRGEL